MSLAREADPLRLIAPRLGEVPFKQVTAHPGVHEALRLTIQYDQAGQPPDSVATLRRGPGADSQLVVVYDKRESSGAFYHYTFGLSVARYQAVLAALRQNRFDSLDDEENLPLVGVDKWLLARVSGSFHHDVVLAPQTARGHHRELAVALRKLLPEATRTLVI